MTDKHRYKYGAWHDPLIDPKTKQVVGIRPDWRIEADMYLCDEDRHPPGWLGKAEHFMRMITCIWGRKPNGFQWNPNAMEIVRRYFENRFLAIAGHGSSGKSETIALIAVAEFIAKPDNTTILVTSTTLAESRGRIWGRIEYYWNEFCEFFGGEANTPGKLVSSSGVIRYSINGRDDATKGIRLVPGRESEVKEGVGRMKGFKADRVRFLCDEMSDLSHKLLDGAESNLFINPDFKMVGCFNPASHFDPAGVFSEPKDGWSSINVLERSGWETKRGWCIRFDGISSPNVLAGRKIWMGLLTKDKLDEARKNLGDNSPRFMEQYRGAWSETGHADGIYSEAEIIKYFGMKKVEVWMDKPVLAGGFDPSFSHGGDRAVLVIGKIGKAVCFEKALPAAELQEVIYLDNDIDTTQDKKELIIHRLKEACMKHQLDPRNLAMDATGGGDVLATLMARDPFFGTKFMKVQFGGAATATGGNSSKEKFANMVSELWYSGKPLLRCGQLRGLKADVIREMTLRLYEETGGAVRKIRVESKENMKSRLNGRSPDTSDAYFLMLHAAKIRCGLNSGEKVAKSPAQRPETTPIEGIIGWGLKKKPKLNEPEYLPPGGGWAEEKDQLSAFFQQ